ncbi:hypothetical protein LCGC14_0494630 [marine sediment metagenome]|uniref:Rrf2 family transcriptional regulator n=1 Tax=marine sediment metagenome TaxID=412755 RepID=A0A0F9SP04_9ZZZZ|nr:Rrf2 family transcriptional regulator [Phycisphaerae bacterium]HDZ43486.1 Rrf2 family transcriptional regulator [Phycisphaerae bacterium]
MEIIRRHSDYGIRALAYLATSGKAMAPCGEIARACGISKGFAYKILQRLASAGLVTSRSGRVGGFRLCKSLDAITLYDVVSLMQGPVEVSKCVVDPRACKRGQVCGLSPKWRKLQDNIVGFLKSTSLQSLLSPPKSVAGRTSRSNRKKTSRQGKRR